MCIYSFCHFIFLFFLSIYSSISCIERNNTYRISLQQNKLIEPSNWNNWKTIVCWAAKTKQTKGSKQTKNIKSKNKNKQNTWQKTSQKIIMHWYTKLERKSCILYSVQRKQAKHPFKQNYQFLSVLVNSDTEDKMSET